MTPDPLTGDLMDDGNWQRFRAGIMMCVPAPVADDILARVGAIRDRLAAAEAVVEAARYVRDDAVKEYVKLPDGGPSGMSLVRDDVMELLDGALTDHDALARPAQPRE